MQQVSHTTVPWMKWRLAPDSDPEQNVIITTADGEDEICCVVYSEEDADLIAAAPELLAACQAMNDEIIALRMRLKVAVESDARRKAKAAIAKATGKTC